MMGRIFVADLKQLDRSKIAVALVKAGVPRGLSLIISKSYVEDGADVAFTKLLAAGYNVFNESNECVKIEKS